MGFRQSPFSILIWDGPDGVENRTGRISVVANTAALVAVLIA